MTKMFSSFSKYLLEGSASMKVNVRPGISAYFFYFTLFYLLNTFEP